MQYCLRLAPLEVDTETTIHVHTCVIKGGLPEKERVRQRGKQDKVGRESKQGFFHGGQLWTWSLPKETSGGFIILRVVPGGKKLEPFSSCGCWSLSRATWEMRHALLDTSYSLEQQARKSHECFTLGSKNTRTLGKRHIATGKSNFSWSRERMKEKIKPQTVSFTINYSKAIFSFIIPIFLFWVLWI